MSRIGKNPVAVPAGVQVAMDGASINVKGAGGQLSMTISALVKVSNENGTLSFSPADASRDADAMTGTMRQMVNNMVNGVTKSFEKKLSLVGVGFRAQASGDKLNLAIGFSHPVNKQMPVGIKIETPTPTEIVVKGADRQQVGQIAAEIRAIRPPEPYKGKGIRYADEKISLKETKKK